MPLSGSTYTVGAGRRAAGGRPGVKQKFPLILSAKSAILITKTERQEDAAVDEEGLWRLFFATGLPQAYLAIAWERKAQALPSAWEEDKTAFRPGPGIPVQL